MTGSTGASTIDEPAILDLIGCPTFQRLKGVRQAGPSALAFPFKNVSRFEHSLGVFLLLRRLGADRREQVAGLLHDISHTAFSHAVDFIFSSREQDHHEHLKPLMLDRPDLAGALGRLGYAPAEFYDDSIYPLLERRCRRCAPTGSTTSSATGWPAAWSRARPPIASSPIWPSAMPASS